MDQSLHVFITVVEQQNFTRAAEILHMTQPAVSSYIQNLERAMNVKLLERTNKFVRLNKAGEIVYQHAKDISRLYTRMENLVDDLKHSASGTLSIGSSYTYGEYILPHKIAYLLKSYPQLNPNIIIKNSNEIIELVMHNQIDVGIIEGEIKNEKVKITPFASDHLSITTASNHYLLNSEKISSFDLSQETWLIREEGSGTREMQEKFFKRLDFYPKKFMILGSTQAIKESIEAGLGISLLSHSVIKNELELGKLKFLDIEGFSIKRNFSLVTLIVKFQTRATEVFVELLVKK